MKKCNSKNYAMHSHFASLASFWDVWWIPSPILEALLLNSDWFEIAAFEPTKLNASLPLGTSGAGEIVFFKLSTALTNSKVRSR